MTDTSKINVKLFKKLDSGDIHVEIKGLKNLSRYDTNFIAEHIGKDKIQSLLLDRVTFSDKGAFTVLSKALQKNQSIVDLSIRHTNVSVADSKSLSNILTYDAISPLKKLEFTDTNLGFRGTNNLLKKWSKAATGFFSRLFSRKQIKAIRAEQKKNEDKGSWTDNKNLTHLVLRDNKIDGEDLKRLVPVLKRNHAIQHLDLSYNSLNFTGIKAVLGILKESPSITKLVLREVVQTNEKNKSRSALKYMYQTLQDDKNISYLDISRNHEGVRMIPSFAKFIKENKSVVTLISDANELGDRDIARMVGALKHNTTIRTVSLKNNPVSNTSIKYFLQLLGKDKHETITKIDIDIDPDNQEDVQLLNELNTKLNRNKLLLEKKMTEPLDKIMIKDLYKIVLEYL